MLTAMEWRAVPRAEIGRAAWDAAVDEAPEAWLWHRFDFCEALATWPGRDDRSIGLFGSDGRLVIVPAQVVTRTFAGVVRARRIDSVGGPATSDVDAGAAALRALTTLVDSTRSLHATVTTPSLAPAWRAARTPGWADDASWSSLPSSTWVVDLRGGENAVLAAMQSRTRSYVRAASRALNVRVGSAPEDVETYMKLHRETYRRTGARPHPPTYFEMIMNQFVTQGLAWMLIADLDGEAIAAGHFSLYKGAAAYWTGASTEAGRASHANELLQWEAMRRAIAAGASCFDSGETSSASKGKARGISEFKRKFGGQAVPQTRIRTESSMASRRAIAAISRLVGAA